MKEFVFCKGPWSVILVNMPSNITRITLHRGCFPVRLQHDDPNFQGHLCRLAG